MPVSKNKDLNFKVEPDFHYLIKKLANDLGISMKSLLELMYIEFVANNKFGEEYKFTPME